MIVVDVNIIVYMQIPGQHSALAMQVFQRDPIWAAPTLWQSEFRNILAGYLRRGDFDYAKAAVFMFNAEEHLAEHEFTVTSAQVLDKVMASRCSAYDCEYVALAEDLNTVLVTADKQILSEFPKIAVSPQDYVRT